MKTAMELRAGNVAMIDNVPMVVQKCEFTKSGRNASVVRMKLKNLLISQHTIAGYLECDQIVLQAHQEILHLARHADLHTIDIL